jgi:predicted RNase H-like HicB family nuclease
MKYLIVIEKTSTGYSAYSPDVDGCVATGATKNEVEKNMQKAIEFHFEGLSMEKQTIPKPCSYSNYLEVTA